MTSHPAHLPTTMAAAPQSQSKKRKREIEERRRAIDAKRRRVAAVDHGPLRDAAVAVPQQPAAVDPFARLEGAMQNQSQEPEMSQADVFLASMEKELRR